jgi:hypothetical protein
MFINVGARKLLLQGERARFLAEEWPRVWATIQRLGLTPQELLDATNGASPASASPAGEKKASSAEETEGNGSSNDSSKDEREKPKP